MSSAVLQNLIYALNQVAHNFGAAGVVGFATYGLMRRAEWTSSQRTAFLGLVIAWAVQGISGAVFGITSLSFYGELPDIHGVAVVAVSIKMICVVAGFIVAFIGFRKSSGQGQSAQSTLLVSSFVLGAIALSAAAFLRWFS